jgi:2-(1,2-epoxy-1,2-dihydrophenyl)acetyl-CoA isomerase
MPMSAVLLRRNGAAVWITLNRPDAGNAINMTVAKELALAARQVAADPTVRCVVLTGAGRLFCAGGDVGGMDAAGDKASQYLRELADSLHGAIETFTTMAKPFVVVVNGSAAGAGLSLALLGDVVIASRSAHFTAAYTSIGLTPDGGMSWLLPRIVGLRRAQAMILTNQRVGAEEAERLDLITKVVDADRLVSEADQIVDRLAAAPTAAIGAARQLILQGASSTLREHLDREAETIAVAGGLSEAREGMSAFLDRRKPDFKGS